MNRKRMSIAVLIVGIAILAATFVTASSWTFPTPLYTFRMEQASSKMNFLPSAMNDFVYSTEKGCTLNSDAQGCCNGSVPLSTSPETACTPPCEPTEAGNTCGNTCPNTSCNTCWSTCPNTCPWTCEWTCLTCYSTCCTCKYCDTTEDTCEP